MPRINPGLLLSEEDLDPKIAGQAHRLPKKLHGNRERLPYRKRL